MSTQRFLTAPLSITGWKGDWVYGSNSKEYVSYVLERHDGYLLDSSHASSRDENGIYRAGGPFTLKDTTERRTLSNQVSVWRPNLGKAPAFVGSFVLRVPPTLTGVPSYVEGVNPARDWGASAWKHARARLTTPDFSPLQPLWEIRELPRTLRGLTLDVIRAIRHPSNRRKLKAIGELHLAYQFGWLPLWRDIRSFLIAHKKAQKRAVQLIRDEGRLKRVAGGLAEGGNTTTSTGWNAHQLSDPVLVSQCYKTGGVWNEVRGHSWKAWYSGAFRYWLPPGPKDTIEYRRRLERALWAGVTPTPSLIYNITPWSWLIDWYTGLGDFFDAVSKGVEDRLAADYFYVMYSRDDFATREGSFDVYINNTQHAAVHMTSERRVKLRSRDVASPFGFGASQSSLTASQWGILGALGLSKL